jgi:hypothetical protein
MLGVREGGGVLALGIPSCPYLGDLLIDLRRVAALAVWVLHRCKLQHAHAKAVHIHLLIILLLIQFWRHELRVARRAAGSQQASMSASRKGEQTSHHLRGHQRASAASSRLPSTARLPATRTSGVPSTLCGVVRPRQSVASPRSPILMTPLVPFTKMLSHLRSRWMMAGSCACRYTSPCRICHAHRLSTCSSMCLCFLRYLQHRWHSTTTTCVARQDMCCCCCARREPRAVEQHSAE